MTRPIDVIRSLGTQLTQGSPQGRALGIEFISADIGRAALQVPYREDLVGDPDSGVIAGGVVTTLLDHTCGLSVWSALEEYRPTVTLDLRIDYMRAAEPGRAVIAEAHCYKLTRSIAFVRASAHDGDPADPVATAQASFMLDVDRGKRAPHRLQDRMADPA